MAITFHREMNFRYGEADRMSPLVRRVIAENPSAFTFHGTGTYIVGDPQGKMAVIDPGPALPAHLEALLAATSGGQVSHILITHTHEDHSPLAVDLAAATGAPIYGFGPHPTPPKGARSEEAGDMVFRPDVRIGDGGVIRGEGWTFEAIHTPGHISNHLCFALQEEKALFPGDHVMGWSTSVVSPPDGSMADYFASLRKLLPRDESVYYPTHGPQIPDPLDHVQAFIAHREAREEQILACVADGQATIPEMVARMYKDVPAHLHPAAARSVLAHLIHMTGDGRLAADPEPGEAARYSLP